MKNLKKLPESELKVMMVIWDNTPPVARSVLSEQLKESWADPTILTLLSRLVKKGFLLCEKNGNKNMYTPLISKEEYMVEESTSLSEKMNKMSITNLMSAFVKKNGITKQEIDELEKMIDEFKQNAED